jgi:hypothetical protein
MCFVHIGLAMSVWPSVRPSTYRGGYTGLAMSVCSPAWCNARIAWLGSWTHIGVTCLSSVRMICLLGLGVGCIQDCLFACLPVCLSGHVGMAMEVLWLGCTIKLSREKLFNKTTVLCNLFHSYNSVLLFSTTCNKEVCKWNRLHKTVVLLNSFSHEKTLQHDTIEILYKIVFFNFLQSVIPTWQTWPG